MKIKHIFLLILYIISISLYPTLIWAQQKEAVASQLQVTSDPQKAWIFINDQYKGESGENFFELAPGEYEILALKTDYLIQVQKVKLEEKSTVKIHFSLPKDISIPYGLSIKNAPEFVASAKKGVTILQRVYTSLLHFHVSSPKSSDLFIGATETILEAIKSIRDRHLLLQKYLTPSLIERYYGKEVDLSVYPEISFKKTSSEDRVIFEVTVDSTTTKFELLFNESWQNMLGELIRFMNFIVEYDKQKLISLDALFLMSLQGMIGKVDDPFTYFLSPRDMKELKIEQAQKLGGLGMVVSKDAQGVVVIAPIDGSPAARAGIREGDHIVKVSTRWTKDMSLNEAVSLMRGDPGTQVTITVQRKDTDETFTITLTREIIDIRFIQSKLLPDNIGYIKITSFMGEKIPEQFLENVQEMEKKGMKGLIIDVRNNPGGLMTVALKIVDFFVSDGLIFSVKGRLPDFDEEYNATSEGTHLGYPIVVLINEGSASASEIVAGILKETKRAVTVGVKSYGKGSVQHIYPLSSDDNECAIALTVAYYYILGRDKIHKKGIIPDVEVKIPRELSYKIASKSIFQETPKDWEDPQLDKAIEILKEKLGIATKKEPEKKEEKKEPEKKEEKKEPEKEPEKKEPEKEPEKKEPEKKD